MSYDQRFAINLNAEKESKPVWLRILLNTPVSAEALYMAVLVIIVAAIRYPETMASATWPLVGLGAWLVILLVMVRQSESEIDHWLPAAFTLVPIFVWVPVIVVITESLVGTGPASGIAIISTLLLSAASIWCAFSLNEPYENSSDHLEMRKTHAIEQAIEEIFPIGRKVKYDGTKGKVSFHLMLSADDISGMYVKYKDSAGNRQSMHLCQLECNEASGGEVARRAQQILDNREISYDNKPESKYDRVMRKLTIGLQGLIPCG
jgi:hypothetical protein